MILPCRTGTMQILDARHIELFLCDGYLEGNWDYELLGSHENKKHAAAATGGIFDVKHLNDQSTAGNRDLFLSVTYQRCVFISIKFFYMLILE